MKTTTTTVLILIVTQTREAPSSTFPAAPVVDTDGAEVVEEPKLKPLAKCLPSEARRAASGG